MAKRCSGRRTVRSACSESTVMLQRLRWGHPLQDAIIDSAKPNAASPPALGLVDKASQLTCRDGRAPPGRSHSSTTEASVASMRASAPSDQGTNRKECPPSSGILLDSLTQYDQTRDDLDGCAHGDSSSSLVTDMQTSR